MHQKNLWGQFRSKERGTIKGSQLFHIGKAVNFWLVGEYCITLNSKHCVHVWTGRGGDNIEHYTEQYSQYNDRYSTVATSRSLSTRTTHSPPPLYYISFAVAQISIYPPYNCFLSKIVLQTHSLLFKVIHPCEIVLIP